MQLKERTKKLIAEMQISDWVKNLQVVGEKVYLDIYSPSPAMHEKKRLEQALKVAFSEEIPQAELILKIENKPAEPSNQIQSKELKGVKNIIAIASGKGGVGKSTVSSNLAISLKNMGFKVGLLDADIYGPSIPTMFDIENEKPRSTEVNGKQKMLPVEAYGIKILSIGFFSGANQAVVWRGPMASKALNQMIHDADWGELDFLLLDLPPGTGDIHLSLVQQLPITGAVIVSTPQNIALADVRKGVAMFNLDSINIPVLGIVENMAYFTPKELPNNKYYIFGDSGAQHLAESLKIPFLGEIPLVQSIREASDVGRPAAMQDSSEIKDVYEEITKNIIENLMERNKNLPPTEVVRITTMAGCSTDK